VGVIGGFGFRGGPCRWDGRLPRNRQVNPLIRHEPAAASWRFSIASLLRLTLVDKRCMTGVQWEGSTILAVGSDFVEAYHRLWRRAVRRFL